MKFDLSEHEQAVLAYLARGPADVNEIQDELHLFHADVDTATRRLNRLGMLTRCGPGDRQWAHAIQLGLPSFRMVSRNGPPEAATCPMFLCVVCGKPAYAIDDLDAGAGYVLWFYGRDEHGHYDGSRQLGPFIAHQKNCQWVLEAFVAAVHSREYFDHASSSSLESELPYLVYNAGHPMTEAEPNVEYVAPSPSTWRLGTYTRTSDINLTEISS